MWISSNNTKQFFGMPLKWYIQQPTEGVIIIMNPHSKKVSSKMPKMHGTDSDTSHACTVFWAIALHWYILQCPTFALHWYILLCPMNLLADREGPDQTRHMCRLIWTFAVHICLKTCFGMALPILWRAFWWVWMEGPHQIVTEFWRRVPRTSTGRVKIV